MTGLEREDLFCVVSEQFLTDTARYADVVFPACTQIEQLDVVTSWGHLYVGWNEPAIAPLGESVPNTELWRRLARAMGFAEPELFEADESLLASALTDMDVDQLRERGVLRLSLPEDLRPYAEGGFPTASGKVELSSEALVRAGHPALPTYTRRAKAWPATRSCWPSTRSPCSRPSTTPASSTPRTRTSPSTARSRVGRSWSWTRPTLRREASPRGTPSASGTTAVRSPSRPGSPSGCAPVSSPCRSAGGATSTAARAQPTRSPATP